eukprot:COSAG01_NODE_63469_length_280_cov_0.414365_2_plen_23_part_01
MGGAVQHGAHVVVRNVDPYVARA